VLPRDIARYRKFPSRDTAPEPERVNVSKAELAALPDGLYALVAKTGDLHILNSGRPRKAMLLFNRGNAAVMREEEATLPFKRENLVLWLDPFFPESDAEWLGSELEYWVGRGQRIFVANNAGHLGILRSLGHGAEGGLSVIAGPYLYAFNRWAAAFLLDEGARFIVPPLEISKQDYQRVAEVAPAGSWMPIVFSYPALFRIRADLAREYDFRTFRDRDGSAYELSASGDGSVVTPMKPFSILDRIPFLQKDGVGKFILDFSSIKLTKPLYKQVMRAAIEGRLLPETGRFNWKEGFWMPEETNGPDGLPRGGARDRGREG
jgi:putative protease